jgi:L-threonylcarbamoyladenylate synthase
MDTLIINAKDGIDAAAQLIKQGETVVFPTETVYGLGADAFDGRAVAKIFEAKGRPQDNPLIVHIADLADAEELAVDIPPVFYRLAKEFMPGPLTLILKKSAKVPYSVTAGGDTVGIRMPSNVYARELIKKSFPLAAPSANRSKHISPTTAQHVYEDLKGKVPLILDGGACSVGIESTVLDLTGDTPTILRPGAVTAEMLVGVLDEVLQNGKVVGVAKAPGMKYTHYAPTVETVVAYSPCHAASAYDSALEKGVKPVVVAGRDFLKQLKNIPCKEAGFKTEIGREYIDLGTSAREYAQNVYAALHTAEKLYEYIIIEGLEGEGIEASVMNRVTKAAGGKTV